MLSDNLTNRNPLFNCQVPQLNLSIARSFESLADEWRALGQTYDLSVFQSYDWVRNFAGSLHPNDQRNVLIVVGRGEDDRIVLLLPLKIDRKFCIKIATVLGDQNGAHQSPFYAPQKGVLNDRPLPHQLQQIILSFLDADCLHMPYQLIPGKIIGKTGDRGDQIILPDMIAEAIFDRPWADYDAAHRKSKARSRERNRLRKLQSLGEVSFIVADENHEGLELFQWLGKQKTSWLREQGLRPFMATSDTEKFLRSIAFANDPDSSVKGILTALKVGDKLGAVSLGVLHNNQFSGLVLAVSRCEVFKYSPGRLLISKTLEWCSDQGVKSICFGASLDGGLGKDWMDRRYGLASVVMGTTLRGKFIAFFIRGFWHLRAFTKRNGRTRDFYYKLRKGLARLRWPEFSTRF